MQGEALSALERISVVRRSPDVSSNLRPTNDTTRRICPYTRESSRSIRPMSDIEENTLGEVWVRHAVRLPLSRLMLTVIQRSREYIIPSVAGPLCTSLSTLELFMDSMLEGEPWLYDAVTVPLPWRKDLARRPIGRPLRIGYYYDDGYVRVQPPMELAVRKAVDALAKAGHEGEWRDISMVFDSG